MPIRCRADDAGDLGGCTRRPSSPRARQRVSAGNGRRIIRGPYQGERVYSLRQWLNRVRSLGQVALLEMKPVLTNPKFAAQGWKEISDPISERHVKQQIMVYSEDPGSSASWPSGFPPC